MTIDKLAVLMQAGFSNVKKNINKKIEEEIDKLAASTAKGFESVDKRFDQIDGKIAGIDRRIDTFAINRVKYEDFSVLEKRVKKLQMV